MKYCKITVLSLCIGTSEYRVFTGDCPLTQSFTRKEQWPLFAWSHSSLGVRASHGPCGRLRWSLRRVRAPVLGAAQALAADAQPELAPSMSLPGHWTGIRPPLNIMCPTPDAYRLVRGVAIWQIYVYDFCLAPDFR